ncbi:hypothetical protein [Moritella sp.]|uniref:hypothetical protein n=1 Tax=Moritella sp. TaxID=78556 RepID=UPI0025CCDEC9|nr:hypothetical protein [Moritella sp.]
MTQWPTNKISDAIGVLLTISAAITLFTQIIVIKKKKLQLTTMYRLGALLLFVGFLLFLLSNIWGVVIAMSITTCGAALLVPAYTAKATAIDPNNPGAIAGYISMSHTLGYGFASLLAYTSTLSPVYPIYICIVLSSGIMAIAFIPTHIANIEKYAN